MRHTDLRLTVKVYTDPWVFDLSQCCGTATGIRVEPVTRGTEPVKKVKLLCCWRTIWRTF